MPAMLDDPESPAIVRPQISQSSPSPSGFTEDVSFEIAPRQVTLRDRVTTATLVPFSSPDQVPPGLLSYLCDQLNREIEKGDTYPMIEPLPVSKFGPYWFASFGAVMLLGSIDRVEDVQEGKNWSAECVGSFYIKPNYPGRSSHVCNGGFLVTDAARGRGVGRLMGEGYLEWAPMLGYTYSVFNLVYETNVASCRIWDALGFKRIGRVKGCGNLKSYPDDLIDAIIYGRDLGPDGEDYVSEERFDKIKFYLKHGKYPNGADRAEKSRLRSAATHYKLLDDDRLMLKDKEVVADPQRQYEIARTVHIQQHGGINKTTATIAEKYHWVRIKETVSLVIKNCEACKEMAKTPVVRADGTSAKRATTTNASNGVSAAGRTISLPQSADTLQSKKSQVPLPVFPTNLPPTGNHLPDYSDMPLDPQIIGDMSHLTAYQQQAQSTQSHQLQSNDSNEMHIDDQVQSGGSTDYQALLESEGGSSPQMEDVDEMVQGEGDGEMRDTLARRARAAARAAQRVLGEQEENDIKRKLNYAGYGVE